MGKQEEERQTHQVMINFLMKTSEEETKKIEMQNLYEVTRNEHVIYSRNILALKVSLHSNC